MSVLLLLVSFVLSLVALFVFIGSMTRGLFGTTEEGSQVIFSAGEQRISEDPAARPHDQARLQAEIAWGARSRLQGEELAARAAADRSSAGVAFACLSSAVFWLVLGSIAGLVSSIKLHSPDWLTSAAWITFGRIRPVHLNAVIYGWSSLAGMGIAPWLTPRLLKTRLVGTRWAFAGIASWNVGVCVGLGSILLGRSTGLEWLEFLLPAVALLVAGGALAGVPLLLTLQNRQVGHLYVSVWYIGAPAFDGADPEGLQALRDRP